MIPERSIWLKLNRSPRNSDFRLRIGSAVKDHLGVYVHEKFALGLAERLCAPACSDPAEKTAFGNQLAPT